MKKTLINKILLFISVLCIICLVNVGLVYADNASLSISSDEKTFTTEDIVTINIDIEADNSIKEVKAIVTYDSTLFDFQEGDSDISLDKEGIINIEDKSKSGGRLRNYSI